MKVLAALVAVAMLNVASTVQAGGTLTLDAVVPVGVQNSLVIGLNGTPLSHSGLSGTIDIAQFTGDGVEATGFKVQGGLISASDAGSLLQLIGVLATPRNNDPSFLNPVASGTGDFDATGVELWINAGSLESPGLGLGHDFSVDPITVPGSGTGTMITNSVTANVYNVTLEFPIAFEFDLGFGIFAQFDGFIVATGDVTATPVPEPTSSLLLISLAAGFATRRRRA